MPDLIQLLPDAIANQIAAGEVIQRPASAVKELLENAIDAKSTRIELIVKDAGKSLIQVIDDGLGMSPADARMSFERHATSKIRELADIYTINTKGFRGEALASMAAIAQVEMKTKAEGAELGSLLKIEGSKVIEQSECPCNKGTSISIKNIFYNVPARRKFLKSNPVELRHIIDEFQRVALAHPEIHFSFTHNGSELHHLRPVKLKRRIVNLFGKNFESRLVPVDEVTDYITINGFIGKPEFSKKTRGEQFFYVNHRFIKSSYLHHAVMSCYIDLLPKDTFPLYVIFIDIDPSRIDVNVHPTKQEIKFEDQRTVYHLLQATIKKGLGSHNITPSIDFDQEAHLSFDGMGMSNQRASSPTQNQWNGGERPVHQYQNPTNNSIQQQNVSHWKDLFGAPNPKGGERAIEIESRGTDPVLPKDGTRPYQDSEIQPQQIHGRYILYQIKSGVILVDQQTAHERILYERFLNGMRKQALPPQKSLFPIVVEMNQADQALFQERKEDIRKMGIETASVNDSQLAIQAWPSGIAQGREQRIVEELLEQIKIDVAEPETDQQPNMAWVMAKNSSIKKGQRLEKEEMKSLIDQLFACEVPYLNPRGALTLITLSLDDLESQFQAKKTI